MRNLLIKFQRQNPLILNPCQLKQNTPYKLKIATEILNNF